MHGSVKICCFAFARVEHGRSIAVGTEAPDSEPRTVAGMRNGTRPGSAVPKVVKLPADLVDARRKSRH